MRTVDQIGRPNDLVMTEVLLKTLLQLLNKWYLFSFIILQDILLQDIFRTRDSNPINSQHINNYEF